MAICLPPLMLKYPCSRPCNYNNKPSKLNKKFVTSQSVIVKCESKEDSSKSKLRVGSPIIVVEAPKFIKTAASVACLRVNAGLLNPGDVGRIVSRKPKDVWAVRLSIGTYLLHAKYFKPLALDETNT